MGLSTIIQLLWIGLVPAALLSLSPRIQLIRWLSPAFFCYVAGMLMTAIPGLSIPETLANPVISATVVTAIPLMLFSTHMKSWLRLAPVMSLSMGLWTVSIALSASLGIFLFRNQLAEVWNLGGMAAGVYIGGTANMAAIQVARDVEKSIFVEMNLTDMILSAFLLVILLTVAQRILKLMLPRYLSVRGEDTHTDRPSVLVPWQKMLLPVGKGVGLSVLVLAVSAGISWLIFGKLVDSWIIVFITMGGLLASLIPFVRHIPYTYETGEYIFLVFCVAIGSQVDIGTFLQNGHPIMGLMACTLYGGLLLHLLLARIFKIDADTVVITITAGTFGPPFIGPVANSLQNREIVASGMTMGVVGLALGNFVGLLLSWLWGP